MDFPQQIEETLVESATEYDVTMEPILQLSTTTTTTTAHSHPNITEKSKIMINFLNLSNNVNTQQQQQYQKQNDLKNTIMTTSGGSILDDTTPSDSGVQLLDSESSELMVESLTSQNGFELIDDKNVVGRNVTVGQLPDLILPANNIAKSINGNEILNKSDLDNSNVITSTCDDNVACNDDVMTTSNCSTFDATENIVFRRKGKKQNAPVKAPKKRVSFHEDILKNTRTDNIHIEHGFITYKNGRKSGVNAGRYSWCSENDASGKEKQQQQQLYQINQNEKETSRIVYRNACSDVLDYGNADVFENVDSNYLKHDNSGVFEYKNSDNNREHNKPVLYKCSCSSSNSSLDSDEAATTTDKNSNCSNYTQAKSNSCDCIGINSSNNNNFISGNCYFSEPNINDEPLHKSVWNKEKKPKSSCLKKSKSRYGNVIEEYDLSTKVKKFNVHDVNQLFDNSKMIFGSLKSIFSIPLAERGVPEGSEDVQSVYECIPENEHDVTVNKFKKQKNHYLPSSPVKSRPFLSKSLDGGPKGTTGETKKFIHNVDEQLRRKNEMDLYAPTRQNSDVEKQELENDYFNGNSENILCAPEENLNYNPSDIIASEMTQVRNKYIINCESTVFEHTGVSYTYEESLADKEYTEYVNNSAKQTPIVEPPKSLIELNPIKQTFVNIFKTLKETATSPTTPPKMSSHQYVFGKFENFDDKKSTKQQISNDTNNGNNTQFMSKQISNIQNVKSEKKLLRDETVSSKGKSISSGSSDKQSLYSETASNCDNLSDISWQKLSYTGNPNRIFAASPTKVFKNEIDRKGIQNQTKHLASPMRKHSYNSLSNFDRNTVSNATSFSMSPDLFNFSNTGSGRESKNTNLSEEFDDILTITTTTDTDKNDSDIVIIDYPENLPNDKPIMECVGTNPVSSSSGSYLKPPKANLLNRFLRNVTQKKIMESSIRKNNFFTSKIRNEKKLFADNLYIKGAVIKNNDLIDSLNAEIAMEIEQSGINNSPRRDFGGGIEAEMPGDLSRFELGIGEISIDIFNSNCLHILRNESEILMKVFKLYTGYSREGFMTPVLVFLTDKALYVTDLVRNRLCSKLILPYSELDVILMGPHGNTVLLSNESRDMQQVLLAGGPYPADALVANLELCARRSGSILPAVGQLTLGHLEPLQVFVRENSSVSNNDNWLYYAIVNVPTGTLGTEQEPLGPNAKGFLMHRRIKENENMKESWHAGYFLLKAGVLYMFTDSSQKLPTWAMALAECQGARRAVKTGRPHCFEILLKHDLLQLAAPDEYVASEWLQALVQSASGQLFEMQEKHKTLGCTLIMTENHLITLREDFSSPLKSNFKKIAEQKKSLPNKIPITDTLSSSDGGNNSALSSAVGTPSDTNSSINSTPVKTTRSLSNAHNGDFSNINNNPKQQIDKNSDKMSSFYGTNSGIEVLTCAAIKEMNGIRISSQNDTWWCILEFSCQEARVTSDDLVIFFSSCSEMKRFSRMLEQLWQAKNNDLFPITILDEDDIVSEQCTKLFMDINRSWEPILSAALGYPL